MIYSLIRFRAVNGFELLIFDCDGVLVDSERIANEVFARVLNEECDLSLTQEDMFNTFVGHSSSQCMQIIEDMLGHAPPKNLENRYITEINETLARDVTAVRKIEQALDEISIPICVASSGSYEKMRTTLGKTKLLNQFKGKLISTSDVEKGKPAADIYLHAAKQMGNISPTNCLVIEDSPLGAQGGVTAGMTVFGYTELMSKERLLNAGPHHLFEDMGILARRILTYEQ